MPISKLNRTVMEAAIVGFEQQKTQIDNQIAELRQMLDGSSAKTAATPEVAPGKRKKFSAAAIERMRKAQKRRWAKLRGESAPAPAPAQAPKPRRKRKLSAAGRAAILAANKKMWARRRAAGKVAMKKTAPARRKDVKKTAVKKMTPGPAEVSES